MKYVVEAVALLILGTIATIVAVMLFGRPPRLAEAESSSPPSKLAEGELRCEGAGAVIIEVDGKDYAVNGMASPRYPPIQTIWNPATVPQVNIDRLIVRGLTLCDWETAATK
jgi:hypothetical protein